MIPEDEKELGNLYTHQQNYNIHPNDKQEDRSQITRYSLRQNPKKSVKLYSTTIDQNKLAKGILKSKSIQTDPTIDNLVLLHGSQIKAIKKAILHHKWEDLKNLTEIILILKRFCSLNLKWPVNITKQL